MPNRTGWVSVRSTNLAVAFFQLVRSFFFITFYGIESQSQHICFDTFATLQHCHIPFGDRACGERIFLSNTLIGHNQYQIVLVRPIDGDQIDGFIFFGVGHGIGFTGGCFVQFEKWIVVKGRFEHGAVHGAAGRCL